MNKKILAKTLASEIHGDAHLLKCSLCAETDRNKLIVEDMVLGAGMSGDTYSFCKKCWYRKDLGQKLLDIIGYPLGLKIKDECLDIQEVE